MLLLRRSSLIRQLAQGLDSLPHLVKINITAEASIKMLVELRLHLWQERPFEIISDQFHRLFTGQLLGGH